METTLDLKGQFSVLLVFVTAFSICWCSKEDVQTMDKEFRPIQGVEVLRAKIGSGPDEIGAIAPPEAAPIGPLSFALNKKEEIYILDQLNSRIQVFQNGKKMRTIPLPSDNFKDIALTPDGKIVLLDSDVQKSLYILDSSGNVVNTLPLEGNLISNPLEVLWIQIVEKGKFAGIWVRVEDSSVRLASLEGNTTPRILAPGKFSIKGDRLLSSRILGEATAAVYRSEENSFSRWEPETTVFFNMYIVHILGLWDDERERIYLGAFLEDEDETGEKTYSNAIIAFNPDGQELGRWKLFVQETPHEIWQPFRLSAEGHLYQLAIDNDDVVVLKYKIPLGYGKLMNKQQDVAPIDAHAHLGEFPDLDSSLKPA